MSFLTIEDLYGQFETIAFPRILATCQPILQEGNVLLIGGRLSIREDDVPKLVAEAVALLEPGISRLPSGFEYKPGQPSSPGRFANGSSGRSQGSGRPPDSRSASSQQRQPTVASTRQPTASQAQAPAAEPTSPLPDDPDDSLDGLVPPEDAGWVAPDDLEQDRSMRDRDRMTAEEPLPARPDNPGKPSLVLWIRFAGRKNDADYQRLLAMLQYFHGDTPVRIYLQSEDKIEDLPVLYHIQLDDDFLRKLGRRYGSENLAIL
jgi:hypothetical protein